MAEEQINSKFNELPGKEGDPVPAKLNLLEP